MDVSRPYSVIYAPLDLDVLAVLAGTTQPLTGRRVADLVRHGSQAGVGKSLTRLVEQGLVLREEAGRALMHKLNRDHLAAPAIEVLVGMRGELLRRLRDAFAAWEVPPAHASMFGSAARGDGDAASDIDLFLVRPEAVGGDDHRWRVQVDGLISDVQAWTGNDTVVIEQDKSDISGLRRSKPPVVKGLKRDAIDLAGIPLRELLPGAT